MIAWLALLSSCLFIFMPKGPPQIHAPSCPAFGVHPPTFPWMLPGPAWLLRGSMCAAPHWSLIHGPHATHSQPTQRSRTPERVRVDIRGTCQVNKKCLDARSRPCGRPRAGPASGGGGGGGRSEAIWNLVLDLCVPALSVYVLSLPLRAWGRVLVDKMDPSRKVRSKIGEQRVWSGPGECVYAPSCGGGLFCYSRHFFPPHTPRQ